MCLLPKKLTFYIIVESGGKFPFSDDSIMPLGSITVRLREDSLFKSSCKIFM